MDKERALNIARGCVLGSLMTNQEKKEVLDALMEFEMDTEEEEDDD